MENGLQFKHTKSLHTQTIRTHTKEKRVNKP